MDYQEFISAINQKLKTHLQPEIITAVHTTLKNNGQERVGITFSQSGTNISPTIYLEEFYVQYQNGRAVADITDNIIQLYHEVKFENSWEIEQIQKYHYAKSKIVYKLIHRGKNKALLKDVPFVPYLDLAIVFYLIMDTTEKGTATILVTNDLQKVWNVSLKDLYTTARDNTPRIMIAEMKPMRVVIQEMQGKTCSDQDLKDNRMYILTNQYCQFGAACILYDHVLEDIGNLLKEDYYILPSSIHELIILPLSFSPDEASLNEMIVDINRTQVSEEEVLSDHAYYYSRRERKLKF